MYKRRSRSKASVYRLERDREGQNAKGRTTNTYKSDGEDIRMIERNDVESSRIRQLDRG